MPGWTVCCIPDSAQWVRSEIEKVAYSAEQVAALNLRVKQAALSGRDGSRIGEPNFTRVSTHDLAAVFRSIDREFLAGILHEYMCRESDRLSFALSSRMTAAAGRAAKGRGVYAITISSAILFECFRLGDPPELIANGLVVRDRLEALINVMQHEMVHVMEFFLWEASSHGRRFQALASRIFGHCAWKHALSTPRRRAVDTYGIKPGDRVGFEFQGARREGIVNAIRQRATVLVPDPQGLLFSDGRRYLKFYVPIGLLRRL